MNIGDYVRMSGGIIDKITDIKDSYVSIGGVPYNNISFMENILKSSPNIIDLIEVGDYVNRMRVKNIMSVGTSQYVIKKGDNKYVCCGDYGLMDNESGRGCYSLQWNNNQIKEILTHEQYENNCYKVERK